MNFHVIGVNHNSAPLEVRERLAVPEAQLPDAIRSLVQQPGVDEGMVLSTCNRVEVVTSTKQGGRPARISGQLFRPERLLRSIRTSMNLSSAKPCATYSAWLPAWTPWWWASRRFWAR